MGVASKAAVAGMAIGGVALFLLIAAVASYNGLVSARTGVDTQASQVGNQYARKLDLIPQIQQVAAQYLQNESSVQASIAALRSGACASPQTLQDQDECSSQVTETNDLIIKVVDENYPELRSATLYQNVQTEMINTENKIPAERRRRHLRLRGQALPRHEDDGRQRGQPGDQQPQRMKQGLPRGNRPHRRETRFIRFALRSGFSAFLAFHSSR